MALEDDIGQRARELYALLAPAPRPADRTGAPPANGEAPGSDPITRPAHYLVAGVEAWDVIEDCVRDLPPVPAYHVASALKYLLRASRKHDDWRFDVGKAQQHLSRLLRAGRE